ncbi:hypothetical protein [Streptomyces leeuwenhoekii]|uniref:Uncharacterized protein n=1 Tax=Streptomyces leeuwenhoekii TaxID=1437453 RepID=A0A0F7VVI5_STRLW|nr:hypothetical protein [Streptomyces leeuwenhoekii]CQR61537.1 Hypothetical Protein sle_20760 [Streptomyces leeuwenhoekii]
MPATLTRSHPARLLPSAQALSVTDLSNAERAVALYASDLPDTYSYRRGDDAQLVAWIDQGVSRMGLEAIYRTAALASGYRRAWMNGHVTEGDKRAEAERFPNVVRAVRAWEVAALITFRHGVSDEARARSERYPVNGECAKYRGGAA